MIEKTSLRQGIIALSAVALLGLFALLTAHHIKSYDRVVNVRGLCEREIMADRAIYPIVYKETGANLAELSASVNSKNRIICDFLKQYGIEDSEISISAPSIVDNLSYNNGYVDPSRRYVITSVVNIYTSKIDNVLRIQSDQVKLLDEGIAVGSGNEWENPVTFQFAGLNDVKPEMIEEANVNARKAAEQFANDSHSRLGRIKEATQGLFSIENRDSNTPYIKKVRVVTSVSYYLK